MAFMMETSDKLAKFSRLPPREKLHCENWDLFVIAAWLLQWQLVVTPWNDDHFHLRKPSEPFRLWRVDLNYGAVEIKLDNTCVTDEDARELMMTHFRDLQVIPHDSSTPKTIEELPRNADTA